MWFIYLLFCFQLTCAPSCEDSNTSGMWRFSCRQGRGENCLKLEKKCCKIVYLAEQTFHTLLTSKCFTIICYLKICNSLLLPVLWDKMWFCRALRVEHSFSHIIHLKLFFFLWSSSLVEWTVKKCCCMLVAESKTWEHREHLW